MEKIRKLDVGKYKSYKILYHLRVFGGGTEFLLLFSWLHRCSYAFLCFFQRAIFLNIVFLK